MTVCEILTGIVLLICLPPVGACQALGGDYALPQDLIQVSSATFIKESISVGGNDVLDMQRELTSLWPLEVKTRNTSIHFRLIPFETDVATLNKASGFYISKYEVTQSQWSAVMGKNTVSVQQGNIPVHSLSYVDATNFLARLCQKENVPIGTYRLATEEEWQFAAKAGVDTSTYVGDSSTNIFDESVDLVAWYYWNTSPEAIPQKWDRYQRESKRQHPSSCIIAIAPPSIDSRIRPVGLKLPNIFGLYDMLGNVAEFVIPTPASLAVNSVRVCGGSAFRYAKSVSWSKINSVMLTQRGEAVGIRVVREAPPTSPGIQGQTEKIENSHSPGAEKQDQRR